MRCLTFMSCYGNLMTYGTSVPPLSGGATDEREHLHNEI